LEGTSPGRRPWPKSTSRSEGFPTKRGPRLRSGWAQSNVLRCDPPTLDLGELTAGTPKTVKLTVTSNTRSSLAVETVKAGCGCTKIKDEHSVCPVCHLRAGRTGAAGPRQIFLDWTHSPPVPRAVVFGNFGLGAN
jgi:hypothetical protein